MGKSVCLLFLLLPSSFSYFIAISPSTLCFLVRVDVIVVYSDIHIDVDNRSRLHSFPQHLLQSSAALHLPVSASSHKGVGLYSAGFNFKFFMAGLVRF